MGFEVGDRVRFSAKAPVRPGLVDKTGRIIAIDTECATLDIDFGNWWAFWCLERVPGPSRPPDPPSREDLLEHLADIRSALGVYAMPGEPLTAAVERLVDRLQSGSATAGAADDGSANAL